MKKLIVLITILISFVTVKAQMDEDLIKGVNVNLVGGISHAFESEIDAPVFGSMGFGYSWPDVFLTVQGTILFPSSSRGTPGIGELRVGIPLENFNATVYGSFATHYAGQPTGEYIKVIEKSNGYFAGFGLTKHFSGSPVIITANYYGNNIMSLGIGISGIR